MSLKASEPIHIGPINGLAHYATVRPGPGWLLRLEIDDHAIEGWGLTQEEARYMFEETCKQWLKNTSQRPRIA